MEKNKHKAKVKLARKMAKRGATDIFNSPGWRNRARVRAIKETKRNKNATVRTSVLDKIKGLRKPLPKKQKDSRLKVLQEDAITNTPIE